MKNSIIFTTILLSACSSTAIPPAINSTATASSAVTSVLTDSSATESTKMESQGLKDLTTWTFTCPQVGLNAAAREVAKVASMGRYQFSYFKIIQDSHHSLYEVHFKSNYQAEPDMRYCVSVYCQQGQESLPSISIIKDVKSGEKPSNTCAAAIHGEHSPVKPKLKKKSSR